MSSPCRWTCESEVYRSVGAKLTAETRRTGNPTTAGANTKVTKGTKASQAKAMNCHKRATVSNKTSVSFVSNCFLPLVFSVTPCLRGESLCGEKNNARNIIPGVWLILEFQLTCGSGKLIRLRTSRSRAIRAAEAGKPFAAVRSRCRHSDLRHSGLNSPAQWPQTDR